MLMNTLGRNRVSALGLGMMRLPQKDGKIDREAAAAMVDRAMEAGINYYDTAWFYHGGESEAFVGEALCARYPRETFYIATKLPFGDCRSAKDAEKIFSTQCQRLQADYVDYYLLHGIGQQGWSHCRETGILDYVKGLREQGRIKHLCFSYHDSPEVLEQILSESEGMFDFVQLQLNYHDWTAIGAGKMYEACERRGIPVVVMEPVRGGNLAMMNPEVVKVFQDADPTASPASWALRFCATLPDVKVVLSGMSNMEQLNDNIKTFTNFKPLKGKDQAVLNQAVDVMNRLPLTGCTGCRYCVSICPQGVDIPAAFRLYDGYVKFNNPRELTWRYLHEIPSEKQATACVECGACAQKCPQNLDIPALLKSVHQKAESL